MAIAVGLIGPMGVAAVLSMVMVVQVGNQLEKITDSYIPAFGDLARTNIRSLERALALRRMVIEKMQTPFNADQFAAFRDTLNAKGEEIEHEAAAARAVIKGLIEAMPRCDQAGCSGPRRCSRAMPAGISMSRLTPVALLMPAMLGRLPIPSIASMCCATS
jgi:hypothetical protein